MLEFLALENYKNIVLIDKKVYFKNLNILIGSNGSGKSNLISCLQFLQSCITWSRQKAMNTNEIEDAISIFGNSKIININTDVLGTVRLAFCFCLDPLPDLFQGGFCVLDISLLSGTKKNLSTKIFSEYLYLNNLLEEEISGESSFLYKIINHNPRQVTISILDSNGNKKEYSYETANTISWNSLGLVNLPYLIGQNNLSPENSLSYKTRNLLGLEISSWKFYNSNNMNLYKIRTSEPKLGSGDIYLSSSGDNLPLVIENLSQDIDFEDNLNIAMKSILPQTRKIRSVRSGRLSLTVEWFFEGNKEPFYLDEMSDGTVRMLCWATILLSPHLPTLLVIDEPELGLHVAWMRILAEWIKQAAQRTQVIITTHSPDLLDHFTDCLENVLCFQRKDNQHFTINPLDITALQPKLEEGWELGDLYRVGDPSVGGWPW